MKLQIQPDPFEVPIAEKIETLLPINALAETINGLFKTEVIRSQDPWRNIKEVEFATLVWVDWFNNRRWFGPIEDIPPAEFEEMYYARQHAPAMVAGLN